MFRLLSIVAVIASPMWFASPAYPQSTPDRSVIHAVAFQQEPTSAAEYRRRAYARWNTLVCPPNQFDLERVALDIQKALELDPQDVSAWRLMATIAIVGGELETATQILEVVIKLAPHDKEAVELRTTILSMRLGPEPGSMTLSEWKDGHVKLSGNVPGSRRALQYGRLKWLQSKGLLQDGSVADRLLQSLDTGPGVRLEHPGDVQLMSEFKRLTLESLVRGTDPNVVYKNDKLVTIGIVLHIRGHEQRVDVEHEIAKLTRFMSPEAAEARHLSQIGHTPKSRELLFGAYVEKLMSAHQWANRWEQGIRPEQVRARIEWGPFAF